MSTVKTNNVQVGQSGTASNNFTLYQPATPDGTVRIANGNAGSTTDVVSVTSAGLLRFNSGYGSVATAYGCRAWVNFNGTGVVAIRASGNVSSITDVGTGDYTVNFTTAMPDVNYSVVTTAKAVGTLDFQSPLKDSISSSFSLYTSSNLGGVDSDVICAAVFR